MINLDTECAEKEEQIEQGKSLELVAKELEKMKGGDYELSCSVLVRMKELIPGLLKISSNFLSFDPTEPNMVVYKSEYRRIVWQI